MLKTFKTMEWCGRFHCYHLYIRIKFLQSPAGAHNSTACPDTCHEMGNLAIGLLYYLRTCCIIMRLRVRWIVILVKFAVFIRVIHIELPRQPYSTVGTFKRI